MTSRSQAPGVPLASVFHSLCYNDLVKLLENLAAMLLPLFAHRFSEIGSLYFGPNPYGPLSSSIPTPKPAQPPYSAFPFSPTLSMSNLATPKVTGPRLPRPIPREFHVGPIISWPFFGTNRGDLTHPDELYRGPWSKASEYFTSCAEREVAGVVRENEGRSAPHKLHLDPDEIHSSRHHRLRAVPGDESDESDEWDLEESEDEWEGPGDIMYRDYRRMQRSTFLVAHMSQREEQVRKEMARWMSMMERLVKVSIGDTVEQFGLDLHDLSLENIFVDDKDNSKIVSVLLYRKIRRDLLTFIFCKTCIIDWESTTTRPLWQCAHLPAFVQTSPFIGRLFREAVTKLGKSAQSNIPTPTKHGRELDLAQLAHEWLFYESAGQRLRSAHRFVEWDGWEEGLVDMILGPEEHDEEWFRDVEADRHLIQGLTSPPVPEFSPLAPHNNDEGPSVLVSAVTRLKPLANLPFTKEKEKEQMLNTTGDYCGGRGGELGRRLEAWLTVNGVEEGHSVPRRWEHHNHDLHHHHEPRGVMVE